MSAMTHELRLTVIHGKCRIVCDGRLPIRSEAFHLACTDYAIRGDIRIELNYCGPAAQVGIAMRLEERA